MALPSASSLESLWSEPGVKGASGTQGRSSGSSRLRTNND